MRSRLFILLLIMCSGAWLTMFAQENYELLYLSGDYEEILRKASSQKGAEDYYWHALILSKKGEIVPSCRVLEEGAERHPGNHRLELLLANLYFESGNFVQARPLLEKHSSSHEMFIRLIELLEFQNSYREAIDLLEARMLSDTLNLSLLVHLGDNYYQLDSNRIALSYYEKVYSNNPDDQATANKLASILVKMKQYKRSIRVCNEILSKDSLNKKFIRIKGSASFSNRDYVTSNDCFNNLYEMGDSGLFVLKHLGLGEIEKYQYAKGRMHLMGAYKKEPDNHEVCFALARGFLNSTQPERGMYYLEKLDSLIQADTSVIIAILLEKQTGYGILEEYEKALDCLKEVYMLDPQPKYIFFMASLYENRLREPELALEHYTRFLELLPPPQKLSDNPDLKGQMRFTMRNAAENSITELKEELFFKGRLDEE